MPGGARGPVRNVRGWGLGTRLVLKILIRTTRYLHKLAGFFFSRNVSLGGRGDYFCGERKCEKHLLFFRGNLKHRGAISPPKPLKKSLNTSNLFCLPSLISFMILCRYVHTIASLNCSHQSICAQTIIPHTDQKIMVQQTSFPGPGPPDHNLLVSNLKAGQPVTE